MNTKKQSLLWVVPLISLVCSLILAGVVGYFYLFHTDFLDIDGIYKSILLKNEGSALLFYLLCTLFCALPLLCLVTARKKEQVREACESPLLLFARCLAGVVMASTLVMYFILPAKGTPYVMEFLSQTALDHAPAFLQLLAEIGIPVPAEVPHYTVALSLLLTIPGALYFLLPGLFSAKSKTLLFLSGLSTLLVCASELLLTHYFMLDFLASPTRVLAILGYSALILFFLLDIKKYVNNESPRLRAAMAILAFLLNTADALPRLVLSFVGNEPFSVTLLTFHTLLRLALGIYAFVSVLHLFKVEKREEGEEDASLENEQAAENQEATKDLFLESLGEEETAENQSTVQNENEPSESPLSVTEETQNQTTSETQGEF